MILQEQFSRDVGTIKYYKYVVVIPTVIVRALNWTGGLRLMPQVRDDGLLLRSSGIIYTKSRQRDNTLGETKARTIFEKWKRGEVID